MLFVRRCVRTAALQAHPSRGLYLGHSTFGVKSLKAFSAASGITVEDCGASTSSDDVSDKWFFVSVGEHDTCSSRALRAELPQYEAAKASLAATIGELDVALPNIMLCKPSLVAGAFARVGVGSAQCSLRLRGVAGIEKRRARSRLRFQEAMQPLMLRKRLQA